MHLWTIYLSYWSTQQDVKKAVLDDMTAVGKEAGLKSFEQVRSLCWHWSWLKFAHSKPHNTDFCVSPFFLLRWRTFTCIQRHSASPTAFSPRRWRVDVPTSAESFRNKYQACTARQPFEKTPLNNSPTTFKGYWCPIRRRGGNGTGTRENIKNVQLCLIWIYFGILVFCFKEVLIHIHVTTSCAQ